MKKLMKVFEHFSLFSIIYAVLVTIIPIIITFIAFFLLGVHYTKEVYFINAIKFSVNWLAPRILTLGVISSIITKQWLLVIINIFLASMFVYTVVNIKPIVEVLMMSILLYIILFEKK